MARGRQILKSDWKSVRADIERIIKSKNFTSRQFKRLSIYGDWKVIEENIYHTFCKINHYKDRPVWLWEHFKLDTFVLYNEQSYKYLDKLVDKDEIVWFFVNSHKDKFWFYEGKVKAIVTVIEECYYIDELYLASKKYEWLICINHHKVLIASGNIMPDRLRQLKKEQC